MDDFLLDQFDAQSCRRLRQRLQSWYARNARDLPWRKTNDPYRIWISEIMLQQTTVKAVVPYYERFLQRFPDVKSLADASESEVLAYWEGLGYYSRGRNLRLAAQQVCEIHRGKFPSELGELTKLPGIGRYTAGAIRSFGFNLPAPIVEANTMRLYCRLLGYDGDPRSQQGQNLLWRFAEILQPKRSAGHLNQSLMELGAVVCTPAAPRCEECPLKTWCAAFQAGQQDSIPRKASRPEITQTVEATVALERAGKWLIRQRGADERWAGMWDFPRFSIQQVTPQEELTPAAKRKLIREARSEVEQLTGILPGELEPVREIRHSVTRYRIRLFCLTGIADASIQRKRLSSSLRWVSLDELDSLPMPVTGRKFTETLSRNVRK